MKVQRSKINIFQDAPAIVQPLVDTIDGTAVGVSKKIKDQKLKIKPYSSRKLSDSFVIDVAESRDQVIVFCKTPASFISSRAFNRNGDQRSLIKHLQEGESIHLECRVTPIHDPLLKVCHFTVFHF